MSAPGGRLPSLTGLRGVAALMVLGFHVFALTSPSAQGQLGWLFSPGSTGVSFFFLLSGFVLAWAWRPQSTYSSYLRNRAARILPAFFLAMLLSTVLTLVVLRQHLDHTVLLADLLLVQDWFPRARWMGVDGPAWSLSAEVFFYVTFPLYATRLMRLPSSWRRWLIPVALSLVITAHLIASIATSPTAFIPAPDAPRVWLARAPFVRILEFIAGAAAGFEVKAGWRPRIGRRTALLVTSVAYLLAAQMHSSGLQFLILDPCFIVLLVAVAASDVDSSRERGLSGQLALRVGTASYFLYLIHFPLLEALLHELPRLAAHWPVLLVLTVGVALLASMAEHDLVEVPLNRRLRADRAVGISLQSQLRE